MSERKLLSRTRPARRGRKGRNSKPAPMLTILFDGIAYGMLLFVMACGLAVTLGLMNFVNLAHGAFAMAGGYITVVMVNRAGVPFLAALPLAFIFTAIVGAVFERTLYVHLYSKTHLEQVLFTIGLVFVMTASVTGSPRSRAPTNSASCGWGCASAFRPGGFAPPDPPSPSLAGAPCPAPLRRGAPVARLIGSRE